MQLGHLDQRRGLRLGRRKERDTTLQPERPRPGVTAPRREVGELGGGVDVGRELERAGERGRSPPWHPRARRGRAGPGDAPRRLRPRHGRHSREWCGGGRAPRAHRRLGPPGWRRRPPPPATPEARATSPAAERGVGGGLERGEQRAAATGLAVQRRAGLVRRQRVGERGRGADQEPLGQLGIGQLGRGPARPASAGRGRPPPTGLAELVLGEQRRWPRAGRSGRAARRAAPPHAVGASGRPASRRRVASAAPSSPASARRSAWASSTSTSRAGRLPWSRRGDDRGEERQRLGTRATGVERERERRPARRRWRAPAPCACRRSASAAAPSSAAAASCAACRSRAAARSGGRSAAVARCRKGEASVQAPRRSWSATSRSSGRGASSIELDGAAEAPPRRPRHGRAARRATCPARRRAPHPARAGHARPRARAARPPTASRPRARAARAAGGARGGAAGRSGGRAGSCRRRRRNLRAPRRARRARAARRRAAARARARRRWSSASDAASIWSRRRSIRGERPPGLHRVGGDAAPGHLPEAQSRRGRDGRPERPTEGQQSGSGLGGHRRHRARARAATPRPRPAHRRRPGPAAPPRARAAPARRTRRPRG